MKDKNQTINSFKNKWEQNRQLAFAETIREGSDIYNWILERNGFNSAAEFQKWLHGRDRILDAGCGNGRVTALIQKHAPSAAQIYGVDLSAAKVAADNLKTLSNVHIKEGDLLGDLSSLGKFDLIYCQEVLHHTANPHKAFQNLCASLSDHGEIAIYVYRVKAPIREYADDFIRDKISNLPYEEALISMKEITELGRILSDLKIKINVPDVKVLDINAGEYDIQRFLYHFFLKCFWNSSLKLEENIAINYDWYHPQLCTRHTLEEIESWFVNSGLKIIHRYKDNYGITFRGINSR